MTRNEEIRFKPKKKNPTRPALPTYEGKLPIFGMHKRTSTIPVEPRNVREAKKENK